MYADEVVFLDVGREIIDRGRVDSSYCLGCRVGNRGEISFFRLFKV